MKESPSVDQWLKEAKADPVAKQCGMFLIHNGTVRETPKSVVRAGDDPSKRVESMNFSYDHEMLEKAVEEAKSYPGIYYVRAWLNEGHLNVGDDIMYILMGGDIRDNTVDGLLRLVKRIKTEIVKEIEINA